MKFPVSRVLVLASLLIGASRLPAHAFQAPVTPNETEEVEPDDVEEVDCSSGHWVQINIWRQVIVDYKKVWVPDPNALPKRCCNSSIQPCPPHGPGVDPCNPGRYVQVPIYEWKIVATAMVWIPDDPSCDSYGFILGGTLAP